MTFTHLPGDTYVITGFYVNSTRRFRMVHADPFYAMGINLWRGRVWQRRNGKRKLIKEVFN